MRIGSERVTTDELAVVRSPFDGSDLGAVPVGGSEHVGAAVAAAAAVRATPLPAHERARILDAAADRLQARHEEFARSIAGEAAKPITTARVEAARAVGTFRFAAVEARSLAGDVIPMDANDAGVGKLGFTLRIPIGVVGAISPFNFPLNLVSHKVAPAIAAGCPVVLKPASQTPLTALLLASVLLDECGLPAGWLNVVTGGGGTVGNALVDHADVAYITFTGSPDVGWGIKGRAPRKKVGLELGNNAPVIVEPDADLELAAAKIVAGGFGYSGQTCISVQRVYAHDAIRDELVDRVVTRVEQLVVGDPMDDATDVSALINPGERDRIVSWIDEATGGGRQDRDRRNRRGQRPASHRADRRAPGDAGVLPGGLRAADRLPGLRVARHRARAGQRHALRAPGRDLHQRPPQRAPCCAHPRVRRRDRERDADVPHRPDALRRREGQRQHPRRALTTQCGR